MKTDFLGNELEVGDLVIYGSRDGSYKDQIFYISKLLYIYEKIKKKFNSLTNKELEEITKAQKEFDEL